MHKLGTIALTLFGLAACDLDNSHVDRWYTPQQVATGVKLFSMHCASCHGSKAEGLAGSWKVRLEDGSYPPPPLNGSAHAWHHPMSLLLQIVQQGGALYDGKMPGFADKLDETEQQAVIAWFQSLWSDDTYRLWQEANESVALPAPASVNSDE